MEEKKQKKEYTKPELVSRGKVEEITLQLDSKYFQTESTQIKSPF